MPPAPPPVGDLDDDLRTTLRRMNQGRWVALLVFAAVALLGLVALGFLAYQQAGRLQASCHFYRDVATSPVAAAPGAARPGLLGVKIVVDSREAYARESCGLLPPPSVALLRWAAYYHLHLLAGAVPNATPAPVADTLRLAERCEDARWR